MTVPVSIDAMHIDLTHAGLEAVGGQPYFAGDSWRWRFQILDSAGAAVSLSGWLIVISIHRSATDLTVLATRRSDTDIVGSTPLRRQVAIDADQSAEGGTVDAPTGKGWAMMDCGCETADAALFASAAGKRYITMRASAGDGSVGVKGRGYFEIGTAPSMTAPTS